MNPVTRASLITVLTRALHDMQQTRRTMKSTIKTLAAELTAFQLQAHDDRFAISCIQDRTCEDFRFKRDFIAQLEGEIDSLQNPPSINDMHDNDRAINAIVAEEMQRDDKATAEAAQKYFSHFRNNVNEYQLTRFESFAYKNRAGEKQHLFSSLMLFAACEIIARKLCGNNGGLVC